ncbi:hypothetical protein [Nocardia sp. NPDC056000]|uniref:hypothetical protein n=1 Tax=Nocardia sp. NPDC056000 TaxID=3345674 RepID=UPI0035E00263
MDVEMDIDSIDSIVGIDGVEGAGEVAVVEGRLTAWGIVSGVGDDGVFGLLIGSAMVLIESDLGVGVREGMVVRIEPEAISLYPTGI